MRPLLLAAVLAGSAVLGCGLVAVVHAQERSIVPDHSLRAFGGTLIGTDRGEWIGGLSFEDDARRLHPLLKENVRAIVEGPAGVFVFTGLAHMGANEGNVYRIERRERGVLRPVLVAQLPGEPRQVARLPDGTFSFLVLGEWRNGGWVYECNAFDGKLVARSTDCLPPRDG